MHQLFSDFIRTGGEGEFLLRKSDGRVFGRRVNWSVKNSFPDYSALRRNFEDHLNSIGRDNADMLLDALADAYDPPLEVQDLPSTSGAVNETLSEWDQRLSAIWAKWNTHPQRLRPVRQAMEERLLRSFAGLINEIRQRDLGIEQYIWRTVGDEKVRASHSARNGGVYRWNSHDEKSGEAPNCRCSARPVPPGADIGLLVRFLSDLGDDFSTGIGVRPQTFG